MSAAYWENRYLDGGNSGSGSGGILAEFKAGFINAFVRDRGVEDVVEVGCGDGRQLALAEYPSYVGLDVSPAALAMCERRFADDPAKTFALLDLTVPRADLALSLDVIYHLTEDDVYAHHLRSLFQAGRRWVILYTSDADEDDHSARHVRHRRVTRDVARLFPEWRLIRHLENPHPGMGGSDFFVYERHAGPALQPSDVTPIVVTRGNVDLTETLRCLIFDRVVVWDNSTRPYDLGAAGRYAAIMEVETDVVFFIDDDATVTEAAQLGLLAAYEDGVFVSNMNPDHNGGQYPLLALPGWGSLSRADLPNLALDRWAEAHPDNVGSDEFNRIGCDIIFPVLTPSKMIDLGHLDLPHSDGPDRTWRSEGYLGRKAWYYREAEALR